MICTIEDGKIKCVIDAANTVYKENTSENRVALGLEDAPMEAPKPVIIEEPEGEE